MNDPTDTGETSFLYAMDLIVTDQFPQFLARLGEFNTYVVVESLVWLAHELAEITGHDLRVEVGRVLPAAKQKEGEREWLELRQP